MRALTLATVFAAASGYLVLWIAGRALGAGSFDGFAAFWAAFFALGGVANGLMQETTRAVRSARDWRVVAGADHGIVGAHGGMIGAHVGKAVGAEIRGARAAGASGTARRAHSGRRTLLRFGLVVGVALAALVAATAPAWKTLGLDAHHGAAVAILAVGICGFSLQAAMSGALSGTERWNLYALLLTIDAALRLVVAATVWGLGVPNLAFECTTVAGAITWLLLLASPSVRAALRSPVDVPASRFWRNTVQAMAAGTGTAILITGFPLLVTATARPADDRVLLGAVLLAITLTRAPLLVPLTSFQSAIIVWFVHRRGRGRAALAIPLGVVIAIGAVGALAAWAVAGPLVRLVFDPSFGLPGWVFGVLTAASVGTAALMISGNCALALERHAVYNAGWWVACVAAIGLLLALPTTLEIRVAWALFAGPVLGVAVHVAGMRPAAAARV